jgi:hypothetical protein
MFYKIKHLTKNLKKKKPKSIDPHTYISWLAIAKLLVHMPTIMEIAIEMASNNN